MFFRGPGCGPTVATAPQGGDTGRASPLLVAGVVEVVEALRQRRRLPLEVRSNVLPRGRLLMVPPLSPRGQVGPRPLAPRIIRQLVLVTLVDAAVPRGRGLAEETCIHNRETLCITYGTVTFAIAMVGRAGYQTERHMPTYWKLSHASYDSISPRVVPAVHDLLHTTVGLVAVGAPHTLVVDGVDDLIGHEVGAVHTCLEVPKCTAAKINIGPRTSTNCSGKELQRPMYHEGERRQGDFLLCDFPL